MIICSISRRCQADPLQNLKHVFEQHREKKKANNQSLEHSVTFRDQYRETEIFYFISLKEVNSLESQKLV